DEIRPRLAEGVHVVSDRYLASSLAYQSLDAPLDWVRTINAYAPPPDLTLFLDVPPAVALARRAERGREERFDALPLQRRIARRYREVLRCERGLGQVVVIDGGRPVREVEADVKEAVRSLPGLRRL
ncbi:MAG: dTMP kinase, partial [Deltaproteobacteria bacterium]